MREYKLVTLEEVNEAVAYWQPRLHLIDVIIMTGVKRNLTNEDSDGLMGGGKFLVNKKIALLYIDEDLRDRCKDDNWSSEWICGYKSWADEKYIVEIVVVHEMLHFHQFPWRNQLYSALGLKGRLRNNAWDLLQEMEENMINQIARALIELKYGEEIKMGNE